MVMAIYTNSELSAQTYQLYENTFEGSCM